METKREPGQSIWVETWTQLQAIRCVRLLKLGRYAEPQEVAIAQVSAVLKRATRQLLAIMESTEDEAAGVIYLELAFEEYVRDPWALTLVPPFPLSAFVNTTVLSRCWAAAEKTIATEAELLKHQAQAAAKLGAR